MLESPRLPLKANQVASWIRQPIGSQQPVPRPGEEEGSSTQSLLGSPPPSSHNLLKGSQGREGAVFVLMVIYNVGCPCGHLPLCSSRWTQCLHLGLHRKGAFSEGAMNWPWLHPWQLARGAIILHRWEPLTKWSVPSSQHKYFPWP